MRYFAKITDKLTHGQITSLSAFSAFQLQVTITKAQHKIQPRICLVLAETAQVEAVHEHQTTSSEHPGCKTTADMFLQISLMAAKRFSYCVRLLELKELQINNSGLQTHLTATLSTRLIAVGTKPPVCWTVTGAAGLVTPPTSRARQVRSVETHS